MAQQFGAAKRPPLRHRRRRRPKADISPTPEVVGAVRNPVFRRPGRRRHAGGGDVPLKSHPGGGAGLSFPPWCCIVLCVNVVLCDDSLPPPPGWHHIYAYRLSPHVADAQVGEIRGYARRQPPPGVGEMSTFGRRLRRWRRGGRFAAPLVVARCIIGKPQKWRA